jgi:hypothetical protein
MMGMGFHKRGLERFSAIGAIGVLVGFFSTV